MREETVVKVRTDMCAFGMKSVDEQGEAPVLKPTGFMTNSMEVAKALDKRCPGCSRHVHLMSGRASACQVYPAGLCRAVCRGVIQQARHDAADLMSLKCETVEGDEISNVQEEPEDWRKYWDDMSGQELDAGMTRAARAEEICEIHKMGVYEKVTIEECLRETGRMPIGTRWVDTNKGDLNSPKIRSRLVAQEIARHKQPELFAATPPLEYLRFLVSCVASSQWSASPTRLMVQDVKKAYFYADATRKVYVKLPDEDKKAGEEHLCGVLRKSLYGTRDAAFNWTSAYTKVLVEDLGFEKG